MNKSTLYATKELVDWLNGFRSDTHQFYDFDILKRFYRIVVNLYTTEVVCFVAREDFENKTLGDVKSGDIMYPKTWNTAAKHKRGSVFESMQWDTLFNQHGQLKPMR